MTSTFTANKAIEQPSSGSYDDTWATPVNNDWGIIDTAFGGLTTISVTGLTPGNQLLSLAQYQPPNIVFTGTLGEAMQWYFPQGVGGTWSIFNSTSGPYTLVLANDTPGRLVTVPQGTRAFIISDGTNVDLAQTPGAVVTGANPTAAVGLTATNGSSSSFMRADAAPPLSQSISPTWSQPHTFNAGATFNGTTYITSAASQLNGTTLANYYRGTLGSAVITISTAAPSGGNNGDIWLQIP
jgi:hypothetical protein